MSERVPAAERLLDLVIALSHAQVPMSKEQIRREVNGYQASRSSEAFERMFERDKDQLRTLGFPIKTVTNAIHEDEIGYRIDSASYEMPNVRFTPAQMGVLSLAARVWQDASVAASARRGLTKLQAISDSIDNDAFTGLSLRSPKVGPAFEPLLQAIREGYAVSFTYHAASSGQIAGRKVEPWRLRGRGRGWYLVGFDLDRGAERVFRLSRITSAVRKLAVATTHPAPATVATTPRAEVTLTLSLAAGRAGALRRRARALAATEAAAVGVEVPAAPGRDLVQLELPEGEETIEMIAGFGPDALVLAPADVAAAVRSKLMAVAQRLEGSTK